MHCKCILHTQIFVSWSQFHLAHLQAFLIVAAGAAAGDLGIHSGWDLGLGLAILLCAQSVKVNKKICLPTFGVICKHQRECLRKHVHESKGSRVALRIRAEIFYVCGMPKSCASVCVSTVWQLVAGSWQRLTASKSCHSVL